MQAPGRQETAQFLTQRCQFPTGRAIPGWFRQPPWCSHEILLGALSPHPPSSVTKASLSVSLTVLNTPREQKPCLSITAPHPPGRPWGLAGKSVPSAESREHFWLEATMTPAYVNLGWAKETGQTVRSWELEEPEQTEEAAGTAACREDGAGARNAGRRGTRSGSQQDPKGHRTSLRPRGLQDAGLDSLHPKTTRTMELEC